MTIDSEVAKSKSREIAREQDAAFSITSEARTRGEQRTEPQTEGQSFQAACAAVAEPLAALLDHPDLPSDVLPHWHDAISVLNDRFDSEFDLGEKPGAFVRRVFGGIAKAEPRRSSWSATLEDFGKAMQWLLNDDRTPKAFSDAFSDALVALSNEAGSGISQDEIDNRTPELLKRIVRDVKE